MSSSWACPGWCPATSIVPSAPWSASAARASTWPVSAAGWVSPCASWPSRTRQAPPPSPLSRTWPWPRSRSCPRGCWPARMSSRWRTAAARRCSTARRQVPRRRSSSRRSRCCSRVSRAGDLLVLTGSLPSSAPVDLYARLIGAAQAVGARCVLDASGGWLRAALPAAPDVVKVSIAELASARDVTPTAAWERGREAAPEPGSLILTAGRRGARLWTDERCWTVAAARQTPVNPIGAGDAVTAGLCAALASGGSIPDALADGVAWAAAKVLDFDLALDPGLARSLRPSVSVVPRATPRAASRSGDTPPTR